MAALSKMLPAVALSTTVPPSVNSPPLVKLLVPSPRSAVPLPRLMPTPLALAPPASISMVPAASPSTSISAPPLWAMIGPVLINVTEPPPMMKPFGWTKSPRAFSLPVLVIVMLGVLKNRMNDVSPGISSVLLMVSVRPPRSNGHCALVKSKFAPIEMSTFWLKFTAVAVHVLEPTHRMFAVFATALVGSQLLTSWADAERADASSTTAVATARRDVRIAPFVAVGMVACRFTGSSHGRPKVRRVESARSFSTPDHSSPRHEGGQPPGNETSGKLRNV